VKGVMGFRLNTLRYTANNSELLFIVMVDDEQA